MTALSLAVAAAVTQEVVTTPGDDTGRTIALVIGALLGLAVLLAVLTFWYWRRTDPRRAARRVQAGSASGPEVSGATSGTGAAAGPAVPAPPQPPRPARPQRPAGPAADEPISAEEWLRLTGPGQSSPKSQS